VGVKSKKSKKTKTGKLVSAGKKLLGVGGKGTGGKRRKKSALWYVKEKQRLKAKKQYEKERMRI